MARRFTRPLCTISSVHQIGRSGAHRNPKNRGTAQSFQPTLQVGHSPDLSSSHQHQQALALDFAPLLS